MRDRILRAALELFGRDGVSATTLSRLREASGVSVGAFYHHFAGKEQVAEALFVECVEHYQAGFVAELRRHPGAAEGVPGIVAFHVRWCRDNPERARLLFTERPPARVDGPNRTFFAEVMAWWRLQVHHGALPELDLVMVVVLWLGPAQELCRLWLNGEVPEPDDARIRRLGEAALRSLGGETT
ncbi:TetR/AcrR family transcriptional regulator [Spirillospora sp. CA-294931]|uniref:TetR/AcrR family transcriptional regulator n=1 Tax=Spirillospora sp. CA-294931 TaxID=3240042 RepID=UPI003D91DF1E